MFRIQIGRTPRTTKVEFRDEDDWSRWHELTGVRRIEVVADADDQLTVVRIEAYGDATVLAANPEIEWLGRPPWDGRPTKETTDG